MLPKTKKKCDNKASVVVILSGRISTSLNFIPVVGVRTVDEQYVRQQRVCTSDCMTTGGCFFLLCIWDLACSTLCLPACSFPPSLYMFLLLPN